MALGLVAQILMRRKLPEITRNPSDFPGANCQETDGNFDPTQRPHWYRDVLTEPPAVDYSKLDIIQATQYGILERCREIIEGGYDVNERDAENVTLLHWAAINNRTHLAKYYIWSGAIVDALGGELQAAPLHWATRQGHLQMVELLYQHGADPSLQDGEGCCGLHLAAKFGHTAVVAYLISQGENIDCCDAAGMTPLMWAACMVTANDPTKLLLTMGANLTITDRDHLNTALHWAVFASNSAAISLLLRAGANPFQKNALGESPRTMAENMQASRVAERLAEAEYDWEMSLSPI